MAGGTVAVRGTPDIDIVVPTEDNFPALASADTLTDVLGMLTDNVGEDGISLFDLPKIKMPTGGATAFEIPPEFAGEEPTTERKIQVVLAHWQPVRTLFPIPEEGEPTLGELPLCTAADGKHPDPGGLFADGGERVAANPLPVLPDGSKGRRSCANCPMSRFGSHPKAGRKGQACQDRRLMFVLRTDDLLPTLLNVPPTSIVNLRQTMIRLTTKYRVHYSSMILELSLRKVEKSNTYAVIEIRPVGQLDGARPESQGGPTPDSPAWVAWQYSERFAALVTPETIGQMTVSDQGSENGVAAGGIPDHMGGDFADHGDGVEVDDRQSA